MEYRQLGGSGLRVSALSFGTATFGGAQFFKAWGSIAGKQARVMVDRCIDAGINLFDTADSYSQGLSEEILGRSLAGRRDQVLISTKTTFPMGEGPNDYGSSRYRIMGAIEASLRRLGTDYVDIYHMHGFDAHTPVEETLRTLDDLVTCGKVRYIACSNFSGWHAMKSLAVSERYGFVRYVAHQACYSLLDREFEWELMPLGQDQGLGTLVWSPLAWGRLSGKYRRDRAPDTRARLGTANVDDSGMTEQAHQVVDTLEAIARESGRTISQVAINWLLQRPTVSSVILGARTDDQLAENLGAVNWALSSEQMARLDGVSAKPRIYPYSHQRNFTQLFDSLVD